ncbi:MAG: DUF4981 domain-containing protein, partial [Lentisphaeria bacterium]|nr:DUF4981 domain-containing protein [Lentisphaeria bacterium]
HEHDQFRGHYILPKDMMADIKIMKQHNFNSVRNCHYPNSVAWYELCAKQGLLVWDEANLETHAYGYGGASLAKNPNWTEAFVERNQRMVIRSKNNPSIVVWSLGNECGDGINMKAALDWIHKYDPTRPVHSERATYGPNTDIVSTMYNSPGGIANYANKKQTRPFIVCEYTHAMGNSNGNIKEYFDVFNQDNHAQGGFVWDWIDQGLAQPVPTNKDQVHAVDNRFIPVKEWKKGVKVFQTYGGWYENKGRTHDGNFCMNGLIGAERTLHSGLEALKKEQQYFYIHDFDATKKTVQVTSRFHFLNPQRKYHAEWSVVDSRGVILSRGNVGALDLKPTETKTLKLVGFKSVKSKLELFLNIEVKLRSKATWAPARYQVAWEQFSLKAKPIVAKLTKSNGKLKLSDGVKVATITGKNFILTFDKSTGALTTWKSRGVDLLAAPLLPNFWRAYNDNDKGARLQNRLKMWRKQPSKATAFKIKRSNGNVTKVITQFKLDDNCGDLTVSYVISPVGEVKVNYDFTRGSQREMIPRIGMSLAMPDSFNKVSWFGRGPKSTYNDRLQQPVGTFRSTVSKEWEEFSRPQEGGNKTDLRWIKLTDGKGRGLMAIADEKYLQGSVNFFNARQIDSKAYTWQLHKKGKTWFNIDAAQMGLGGINSWGTRPLGQYQLNGKKYSYSFVLKPTL